MTERKRIYREDRVYFVTSTTHGRREFFKKDNLAEIVIDQFYHYEKEYDYELKTFVVQQDHYHLLLDVGKEKSISEIIHAINSYSARLINETIGNVKYEKIWQGQPWTEVIRNEEMYWQKVAYVLLNPWRDGLVDGPLEEYKFSDIVDWKNRKGKDFLVDLFDQYGGK